MVRTPLKLFGWYLALIVIYNNKRFVIYNNKRFEWTLAVYFVDFPCMYQFRRSDEQDRWFQMAMTDMWLLYTAPYSWTLRIQEIRPWKEGILSRAVDVWRDADSRVEQAQLRHLTKKRLEDGTSISGQNDVQYLSRGWCVAEKSWTSIKMAAGDPLALDDGLLATAAERVLVTGADEPLGLLTPEEFDRDVVDNSALYRTVCEPHLENLTTYEVPWGLSPEHAWSTIRALSQCLSLAAMFFKDLCGNVVLSGGITRLQALVSA